MSLRLSAANQFFSRASLRKSVLYAALAVSAVVHALVYWATPHLISVWNVPTSARFDAVIVADVNEPSSAPPIVDAPPAAALSKPGAARVKPTVRRAPPVIAIAPHVDDSSVSHSVNQSGSEIDALKHPELFADASASIAQTEPTPTPTPTPINPAPLSPEPIKPVPDRVADPTPAVVAAVSNTGTATSRADATPNSAELNFPSSINIDYKMTSSVANGVANLVWKRTGVDYEIDTSIQATGFFTSMFVGVFRQVSRGEVTNDGVRPNFFSLQRGEAGADTAEFNRASKQLKIIKHGETHLSPLPERMQDMQSFLFQMAHDASQMKPNQNTIDVQVTKDRKSVV